MKVKIGKNLIIEFFTVFLLFFAPMLEVPSQVVQASTLRKGMSVITKICAQIGVKNGGALWAVTAKTKLNTMVIGYDIYKEKNSATVCAMVAAVNDRMTSYTSTCHFQDGNPEKVSQSFNSAFTGEGLNFVQFFSCFKFPGYQEIHGQLFSKWTLLN
jgi:hypothetical protein